MWIKYQQSNGVKFREEAGNDGDAGGNNDGGKTGDNKDNENNTGSNKDQFANMWVDENDGGEIAGGKDNQQQQNNQQQQQSPDEVFNQHFESLNLDAGLDVEGVIIDIQNGKPDALASYTEQLTKNVYRATLAQTSKMMDLKVAKAVEQATTQANGEFNSTLALNELNEKLPFTKDAAIKPIADGVFSRFIKQGKPVGEAIGLTKQYFERMFKMSGDYLDTVPADTNESRRFGASGADEDVDWLDVLSGS